ncbi:Fructose-2,6-bisphosphatase TIGAR-like [Oopsacas minuta]|uniref:Fructose-2,6-bisphosphatase TIGAR-like n=1 Tax=Oopsacas minuta TaxID=111878 RepID=A0AAV7JW72_9METZ|nr:Fructose-2,6-bisphosphatase TIGAR-like [Oopsacas minuta]
MASSKPSKREKSLHFKLSLIRHGVTVENQLGIYQGQLDTKLAQEGVIQSKRLSLAIADIHYSQIICSPLERTRDTARYALSQNKYKEEIRMDGRLMERSFGSWEGKKFTETAGVPRIGGEKWNDVTSRVKSFLKDVYLSVAQKCEISRERASTDVPHILVITHGGVIATLLRYFKDDYKLHILPASAKMIENTSITSFMLEISTDKNPKLLSVECLLDRDIEHLKGSIVSHI